MTNKQVFKRAFISARITKEPDVKLLSAKVTIKCNPAFIAGTINYRHKTMTANQWSLKKED